MKIDRQKVHEKTGGKCAYCGEPIEIKAMQVDHIIPRSMFLDHIKNDFRVPEFLKHLTESDVNHIDNLHPACRVCNKWKNANNLELFRSEISDQIKRLNNYSSNFRMAKRYNLVEEKHKNVVFYFEALTTIPDDKGLI